MEQKPREPRIFKTRWFERFARKERIRDPMLLEAVGRAESGRVDADLGSGVIKQRIARPGQAGGYRTIIFYQRGERAVFAYDFAKSDRANIDREELKQFKDAALHVLRLGGKQIEELIMNGDFVEVNNEQEISK